MTQTDELIAKAAARVVFPDGETPYLTMCATALATTGPEAAVTLCEALLAHEAAQWVRLTVARSWRCRPGAPSAPCGRWSGPRPA